MKKFLMTFLVLLTLGSTIALAKGPENIDTISFSGNFISDALRIGRQSGQWFIWGRSPKSNYDDGSWYAKVDVPVSHEFCFENETDSGCDTLNGEYWAAGWIGFNQNIKVGQKTKVFDFRMDLRRDTRPSPNYWDWLIMDREIDDIDNCYVIRTTQKEYHVSCDATIWTCPNAGSEISLICKTVEPTCCKMIDWSFEAIIKV